MLLEEINHAKKAVEILIENEYSKLKQKAVEIENNNNLRKNLDRDITSEALEMLDNTKKTNMTTTASINSIHL